MNIIKNKKTPIIKNWREMYKSYAFLLPTLFFLLTQFLGLIADEGLVSPQVSNIIFVFLTFSGRVIKQERDENGKLTLRLKVD